MLRTLLITAAVAAAAALATLTGWRLDGKDAGAVAPLRPNLESMPAGWFDPSCGTCSTELRITMEGGRKYLRLSSTTWNSGVGPLELRGGAVIGGDEQEVYQRTYHDDGSYTERLAGIFVFHPTHNHTHFGDYAIYRLEALSGSPEGTSVKTTFCIIDTEDVALGLPGAPGSPQYTSCGNELQGMSVGWGDKYHYSLPGQEIDITGFPDGNYALTIEADPFNLLEEVDDSDNNTTIIVNINGNTVTVLPATPTPTATRTPTVTPTPTRTNTPTATPTPNAKPSVTASASPPGGVPPLSFNLNWSVSDANNDSLTATIDWDDGSSNFVVGVNPPYPPQSTPHTFTNAGAYDVSINVDDGHGSSTTKVVRVLVGADADGDLVPDTYDNCPSDSNPTQENTDAGPLDNGPLAPGDDVTLPAGDTLGNACDADADNDGLPNAAELGGAPCTSASGATDPVDLDSDGDHLHDGWECAHDSDPASASSTFPGTGTADADADRVIDLWEERGYNGSASTTDADGDGCHDLVEIASIDGNYSVGDSDRLAVARRALGIWTQQPPQDFVLDIDHNGTVGDPDRLFVARAALLGDWQPKICT